MTKLQVALSTLVAAIPAGVLSYLLIWNFLFRTEQMETMVRVVSGAALLFSVIVTVLPFGVLIFGPKTEKPPEEKPAKKEAPSTASQPEVAVVEEAPSEVVIPTRDDEDDFGVTESEMAAFDEDEEFQTEAELESVDFDEDFGADFDDEEKPKKRKR